VCVCVCVFTYVVECVLSKLGGGLEATRSTLNGLGGGVGILVVF
jgi:hypothetical protein